MAYNPRRGVTGQPAMSIELVTTEFNAFIKRFLAQLNGPKAAGALVKIGLDLLQQIIAKNPVDTGRSRAGWYFAQTGLLGLLGQGPRRTPASAAEREGFAQGKLVTQLRGARKWIEITNAVAYILPLEYGWSAQAPYGMVRISMQLITRSVPKHILGELAEMWKRDGVARWTAWRATGAGPLAGPARGRRGKK